ncbi:MAG: hypothetical protein Q4G63_04630 [Bacteroidia bacterium]|nr:hypothetical protein [Bacteroidia bacterium]
MKKENLKLLTYKACKATLYVASIIFIFVTCSSNTANKPSKLMLKDVKRIYQVNVDKNKKQLIFINDVGCPNCIITFSNYILNNINRYNNNSIIFINSKGQNVDIDRFIALNTKDVVISKEPREGVGIIPNLGIIYLKENISEIDTIISIDASIITEQLKYIDERN